MDEYQSLKSRLASGWNTWNTRSVLSHVCLPQGFALNLCLRSVTDGSYLKESLIGSEDIHPGHHTYDGSYTELTITWKDRSIAVQTCHVGEDLLMLVTPLNGDNDHIQLVVEAGILWNKPGYVRRVDDRLIGRFGGIDTIVYATKPSMTVANIETQTPYLAFDISSPLGISTSRRRSLLEIQSTIAQQHDVELSNARTRFAGDFDVYHALQSSLAWDTIYEPSQDRVITTVSRNWNCSHGGYILFCWDTYFAADMLSIDAKELAYANAIEITREKTEEGFIPNFADGLMKSRDRSQPPIGSRTVLELYKKYADRWFLEYLFDDLLGWNRWWTARRDYAGLLCWGSNPYQPIAGNAWETVGVNDTLGGALESGLDNSPMYDGVPFDRENHTMMLADVGLNSLYVSDCEALREIACVLGRSEEALELEERAARYRQALASLWDESVGLFLNRRTDTGELSHRISPTHFYPLLCQAATESQAKRMVAEHFYNPDEFWGDWILPSIARNDPAYREQDYWRGRIWAPMNFLVYLGLCNYDFSQARSDLADRSRTLLLKEWIEKGHVHENYSADTGEGCDKGNSDRFYHWGALLGLIALMESDRSK